MTEPRDLALPTGYTDLLGELKSRVRAARTQALRTVNTQLIELYWSIGKTILERQDDRWVGERSHRPAGRGPAGGVPGHEGSVAVQPALHAQLRRGLAGVIQMSHSLWDICRGGTSPYLLDKRLEPEARDWYAAAAVEYGWSRNVLMNMIMNKTLERTGAAPSNFVQQLVAPDSELAQQVAKDPYNFEFLGLSGEVAERDLENALTSRITETLRELGPGFSFVGRQVHFDVDGDDFYVDLLFFHIEQSGYVVIELKTGKFQPEYAGKLNFYVALVDDVLRRDHHNETIGILICGTKNDRSVRYSLGRSTSPMAVAAYTYDKLPPAEQQALPNEGHIVAALEWAEPETGQSDSE